MYQETYEFTNNSQFIVCFLLWENGNHVWLGVGMYNVGTYNIPVNFTESLICKNEILMT